MEKQKQETELEEKAKLEREIAQRIDPIQEEIKEKKAKYEQNLNPCRHLIEP